MMMSSTAAGSVSLRWPERWAAPAPLAGYWESTTRPTTAGDGSWCVSDPNCCEATSSQVVYDDDLVIHRHQLAAASSRVTSFSSMAATCAVFSDSALR